MAVINEATFGIAADGTQLPFSPGSLSHVIAVTAGTDVLKLDLPYAYDQVSLIGLNGKLYLTAADAAGDLNGIVFNASATPLHLNLGGTILYVKTSASGCVLTRHPGLRPNQAKSQTTVLA